ncbi:peptide chain release factor N(5)-glutamine methyltransferase [Thermodesulforhabdus norvegica]|uniref:Release factor glutamine methyltransferase n=1 Tax=Thermodesulforhabdus norvegica TaxID=39841 RepID=A0A1I4V5D4_9BACT|nr:peptide chain release factor N(5)-glutamine methyltransferase [Thermodesulforhabdus norvegica]SFM96409.1 release factor glutamine methyltransferase [Thermodesulforhabdus norvegica]
MANLWRIIDVLQWTAEYFKNKGIENPRLDAEVLISHALGIDRLGLYLNYDRPLDEEERSRIREYVKRRALREPVHYIIGKREFWSLEFDVAPSVLIPRPETEVLVENVRDRIIARSYSTVVDIGTGSGAIAVALAHEIPSIKVVATDLSFEAVLLAGRNAVKHGVKERIDFVVMNLMEGFGHKARFDVIVSNPPYISDKEFKSLPPEVRDYEPATALLGGGPDGLDTIRRLMREAWRFLKPGGMLCFEIGFGQSEAVLRYAAGIKEYTERAIIKDYAGIPRVVCLERG